MSANSQADAAPEQPDELVDAEVVRDGPTVEPVASLELARRERRSEVIKPLDVDELVESFSEYQALLPRLLDNSDYQDAGGDNRFVKKSGWRKIARAFDLDVKLIHVKIDRDAEGLPVRAEVWARAITPAGAQMEADGYCAITEPRFASASGRKKLEHDIPSTAATRAKNRAISDLVGMGAVSAEEVDAGATGHATDAPPFGPALPSVREAQASYKQALGQLLPPSVAASVWAATTQRYGYMPQVAAEAYLDVARALQPEEVAV